MSAYSFYYLAGSGFNQAARCVTPPTATGDSVNGNVAALYDGHTYELFMHASGAAAASVLYDMNQVPNGGFETSFDISGLPAAGWGKNTAATVTRVVGAAYEGSGKARVTGTEGELYYDLAAAAGEVLNWQVAALVEKVGTAGVAGIRVQNLETGKYWNGTTWQADLTWWVTVVDTTFKLVTAGGVTVEDYVTCGTDRPRLRFSFVNSGGGAKAEFDAFYVWPRLSFCGVFGHNLPLAVAAGVRSGVTSDTPTVRGLLTVVQPTSYVVMTPFDERYVKLISTKAPDDRKIWYREVVLGQHSTLLKQPESKQLTLRDVQDREDSALGSYQAFVRTARGHRVLELQLKHPLTAQRTQLQEIIERSRSGAYSLVVVPNSTDPASAMLCRVPPEWSTGQAVGAHPTTSLALEELPFPLLVP